jgi:hypothetical protein
MLGCDTTSKPFGIGKSETIKLLMRSGPFNEQAAIFKSVGKTKTEIENAGNKAMVTLYRGGSKETLNELRLKTFTAKATKSISHVKPESLPPTSDANSFHSLRVYHQVQHWLGIELNPIEWGWELSQGKLIPTKMSKAPAPDILMKFVKCGCTTSQCNTKQCICRKQGMLCTSACTDCKGISCCNSSCADYINEE